MNEAIVRRKLVSSFGLIDPNLAFGGQVMKILV